MKGALELNKKRVMDIYTEMKNVFWLNENTVLSFDILTKIFKLGHSRIPIFRASDEIIDDMNERPYCIGLLYVKDLILVDPDDNIPITKVLETFDHHRLPIDVWRSDNLQTCMQTFIETCQHLAFVKDKAGPGDDEVEYVGIVTLEDVIEEILKKELVDEYDNYVDHLDHKSSTHRLNEINWESVAEIGEAVDAENRQAKQAQANTRKNSSKLRLGRKDTMVDMKPMPVSGHSRWPQMMTVTQPFMMKRGGQMSKTMQSHVIQQTQHNTNTLKGNVVGDEEMDATSSLSPMMDRDVLHPLYFAINTTSKQG